MALLATTISNDCETLLGGGRYCSERPLQVSRAAELAFMMGRPSERDREVLEQWTGELLVRARRGGVLLDLMSST